MGIVTSSTRGVLLVADTRIAECFLILGSTHVPPRSNASSPMTSEIASLVDRRPTGFGAAER